MRFILNQSYIDISDQPADMTMLRFIRENQSLKGTKEGCASGDCGACTILIGQLVNADGITPTIEYESVNACIAPIASAVGKHLITIEYLTELNGGLHPAQAAMVENHGSQCGFCTPGFVMSLAGLYETQLFTDAGVSKSATKGEKEESKSVSTGIDRHKVCDAISGNLCRCTGYRPIVDAGLTMSTYPKGLSFAQQTIIDQLIELKRQTPPRNPQPSNQYFSPTSLAELHQTMDQHPKAKFIAGGTDLMLIVTQQFSPLASLINLSEIPQMNHIDIDSTTITIGGSATYSAIEQSLSEEFPALVDILQRLGSRQIRNRGTLGGNIANGSPIADTPPILLVLDAHLQINNSQGETRSVPFDTFYHGYKQTDLKPNEYICAIMINREKLLDFHRFYKISKRMEDDISSVFFAIRLKTQSDKITEARIAYGGMAATPVRVSQSEAELIGHSIHDQHAIDNAITAIKQQLTPMSDVRASAQYRLEMAANLLTKALLDAQGESMVDLSHYEHGVSTNA